MRTSVADQLPLVPQIPGHHPHMDELAVMSRVLDDHPETAEMVLADLVRGLDPTTGREGLSGEQTLRAALLKQLHEYSYEELAFHIADSLSFRAFCRIGYQVKATPSASCLQENIKKIRPATMEAINRIVIADAADRGVENGKKVRVDCTVTESNIHHPTDSSLLWDGVRVLTRHLERLGDYGISVPFSDHTRRAKRRFVGIENARKKADRETRYRDLIKVTKKTVGYAKQAIEAFEATYSPAALTSKRFTFYDELRNYIELTERVLDQTCRRILDGESVPATEKIVSIFEPHTDIIVKDRRETLYGHKLCLTAGASGLILDCVVENGNPADSTLATKMIERQIDIWNKPSEKAAFDGGFASKDNLTDIKALGVQNVAFSKSRGLAVHDMVKSSWMYRQLKRFRAGVEGIISFLKRSFGLRRCTWRSFESFKAYTWTSVVAANLLTLARHALA